MVKLKSASKKNKKRIKKLGDSVAKSSIDAIDNINSNKKVKQKVVKADRKMFAPIMLVCTLLIGFLLAPNLWPINKLLPEDTNEGGTYIEGSVSSLGNLNPIFATESAEKTISRLVFSSLFQYSEGAELSSDLAESWEVNEDNTIFTVNLKPGLKWSDKEDINADDVVKTYELIQHPDTESPIRNSWRGVKVSKVDDSTVTFALASPYSPFYKSLTNPILPEHVFSDIPASEVRLSDFSQQPIINSGPFTFKRLDDEGKQAELQVNDSYHGNKPMVEEFIIRTFDSTQEMIRSYRNGDLSAMSGVDLNEIKINSELNGFYEADNSVAFPINTSVFMFLKSDNQLFKNANLRRAVSLAIDTKQIAEENYGLIFPLNRPLLSTQLEVSADSPKQKYDPTKSKELLFDAGWVQNQTTGVRENGDEKFEFNISVQNSGIFPSVARDISAQLFEVGIKANIQEVRPSTLQQNHVLPHNYDAVIFGFEGNNDADSFPIWHSTQTGIGGFNLSEISSPVIDETLEAGRARSDADLRNSNYEAFLKEWNRLAPAVPLYSPNFVYITKDYIKGVDQQTLNVPEDRLNSVSNWYID